MTQSTRQVAAASCRYLIPTLIFGFIMVAFAYVVVLRSTPEEMIFVYMTTVFTTLWFGLHLGMLLHTRHEHKEWKKFTGRV